MILSIFLKITAFLTPLAIFIWLDQLSVVTRQVVTIIFVLWSSLLATGFWLSLQRQRSGNAAEPGGAGLKSSFTAGLVFLLMLILTCYVFPVGGYLARPLVLEHATDNAEAIFVLASGATETGDPTLSGLQRINHGVKLLKEGRAPHLYLSTGYSERSGHTEYDWVATYTHLLSLDPASFTILRSSDITTTFTEAAYARKLLAERDKNKILLVTSGAHIYRSLLTFKQAGFTVLPAPAHTKENIFYSSDNYLNSLRAALHEWIGLVYYRLHKRI